MIINILKIAGLLSALIAYTLIADLKMHITVTLHGSSYCSLPEPLHALHSCELHGMVELLTAVVVQLSLHRS